MGVSMLVRSAMRILFVAMLILAGGCAAVSTGESSATEEPPSAPRLDIVVTTAVHGNEPSGYHVQEQLAVQGFRVFGPCNPWGLANNRRHLENGDDLNRAFGDSDYPEVLAVKKFLRDNPPKLLLDLHEDPNGTGAYLIQHGPDDDIGRRIIDAMKDEFEFDPAPKFLVVEGENGLLKPTMEQFRALKFIGVYGLAFYAWDTYGCTAIVTECPGKWPMERKKAYQLRVCELANRFYSEGK
jgi:hypothetical protein